MDVPTNVERELARRFPGESSWTAESLAHNRWLTAEIWRLRSPSASCIVKRLRRAPARGTTAWERHWTNRSDDPRHWNHWEREALAYETGLTQIFGADGIRAPASLGVVRGDGVVDLWLEDVGGDPGEQWTIDDYAAPARALGEAQGRLAVTGGLPSHHWLSRSFLRDYTREKPVDWSLLASDKAWDQPLVRDQFPPELRPSAGRLHAQRERLLGIVDRLPRTLCHLDFWPKNLFRRRGETMAIDWGVVGDGALGEDIGNLVPDAAFDHFVPADRLPELESVVFDAYVAGLEQARWHGDKRLVQLGMWASCVKYDWLTPVMLSAAAAERQLAYGGVEEVDAAYHFAERGAALLFNARCADRALRLALEVDL